MMRVNELKAAVLLKLKPIGCTATAVELGDLELYLTPSFRTDRCVDVQHRNLVYVVGHWAGWEGAFWMVESRTGIIFRGSLEYIKEMVSLCSAAHYEPHAVR